MNHEIILFNAVIPFSDDKDQPVFVVMPLLKLHHDPEFHCRPEFARSLRQQLEAGLYPIPHSVILIRHLIVCLQDLEFMHSLDIWVSSYSLPFGF